MTCGQCKTVHPATGKTLGEKMGWDCDTKCPIPKLISANIMAMEIINRFSPMIFDGEHISADGIDKALEWSGIPKQMRWNLGQKVGVYFAATRAAQSKQAKMKSDKEAKHGKNIKSKARSRR